MIRRMKEYFTGIDIGSTMTKVVILEDGLTASIIGPTGPEQRRLANMVMADALKQAGLSIDAITYIVSTGYGRINVPFADKQVTEISCHAKGVASLFPEARTIIDIGGQDSKGISIDQGRPTNFIMNDKCAAGSGRFLEVIADALQVPVDALGELGLQSKNPAAISNICTVYAEQEIVSGLAKGMPVQDLVAGVHDSLANRVVRMVKRLKVADQVILTGGVAKNKGLAKVLSEKLGHKCFIPAEPLITGALGAALLGRDIVSRSRKKGLTLERRERSLKEIDIL